MSLSANQPNHINEGRCTKRHKNDGNPFNRGALEMFYTIRFGAEASCRNSSHRMVDCLEPIHTSELVGAHTGEGDTKVKNHQIECAALNPPVVEVGRCAG